MNELTHPSLPFVLRPAGGKPCAFSVDEAGTLTLSGEARSDLFIDPAGEGEGESDLFIDTEGTGDGERAEAGYLVGVPPHGDFTLAARITVPFASDFDAGVLLVEAGPERFAKACFEYSPQGKPMAVSVVTRGVSDDANGRLVDGDTLWLRVTRTGGAWAFHSSLDGTWWDFLRYFSLGEAQQERDAVRVGFLAQSPVGEGIEVTFTQIAYTEGALGDLRDGS